MEKDRPGSIALGAMIALALLGCQGVLVEPAPMECGECDAGAPLDAGSEPWIEEEGPPGPEGDAGPELDAGPPVDPLSDDAGAPPDAGSAVPTPTCDDVDQRLLDDFGLVVQPGTLAHDGLASTDLGCAGRIKVYQMFALAFVHDGYRRRLDPSRTITIHLYRSDDPRSGWCTGYVPNARAIQITDLRECLRGVSGPDDPDFVRIAMFLIHESGHVIADRNDGMLARFRDAELPDRDPDCYDGAFLKTYYYRSGVRPASESFAEAVGLFVGNHKRGAHGRIRDFRAECPNTYAWIRANVFE